MRKTADHNRISLWLRAPQRRAAAHLARAALARLPLPAPALQAAALRRLGWTGAAQIAQARALRQTLDRHLNQTLNGAPDGVSLTAVLTLMGQIERTGRAGSLQAGTLIAGYLTHAAGRALLQPAAHAARTACPDSAYLIHLDSLCQALSGNYRAAAADLTQALAQPFRADVALDKQRFGVLRDSWRVVDLAAREDMDWADDSASQSDPFGISPDLKSGPETLETPETPESLESPETVSQSGPDTPDRLLSFKEAALQGRQREVYLAACTADLTAARNLREKLAALRDMLRCGIRHIPSYTASHDLARQQFLALQGDWAGLLTGASGALQTEQDILDLCSLLALARKLNLPAEAAQIRDRLVALSDSGVHDALLWPAAAEIIRNPADSALADRIMARITTRHRPQTNRDVKNYFGWALLSRHHDAAAVFAALPPRLHRQNGLLNYAQLLQREGQFTAALEMVQAIHAQMLADPARLNAFSNRSLIKRSGELEFLIETAAIFSAVPQPTAPTGVMLLAARNIDALRRLPLLVLVEMKRAGWAVVPLVAGLLPRELTGIAAIDLMNGAISPNIRLRADADAALPPLAGFVARPDLGQLHWEIGPSDSSGAQIGHSDSGGATIDLSQALWEDAAINRRRYSIDWACPELRSYLGGLCDWTGAMARLLTHARSLHQDQGLRIGCMTLFTARLPDAVFAAYCARFGSADGFFALHAANGYQNYFTNFATNLSQRFVLRNMTRHPQARSASFPLPDHFARYCATHQADVPALLDRFAGLTRVRRSTAGQTTRPPQAEAALARIAAWRAAGGKVACAFGKVVCDSGVPFDGGPAHADMQDWINHCIDSVAGSRTLLLIKPHPHEVNNRIATFPTEYFADLITRPLGENHLMLGHRWFDMQDMAGLIDLGLVYNGTTAVELGLMNIPCIVAAHFGPVDYPIGHAVPPDRDRFAAMLRFDHPTATDPDLRARSALWLGYMAADDFTLPYGYHARPVTNTVLYPPWWIRADLAQYHHAGDPAVLALLGRALGTMDEPGGDS